MYVLGEASTTSETTTPTEGQFKDDDGKYLVVPLVVILVVMLLSLLVILKLVMLVNSLNPTFYRCIAWQNEER